MVRQTVLITGCSTGGAGNAMARDFARRGLRVFATSRRLETMSDLEGVENVTLVPLDVTDVESICAARERVKSHLGEGKGLDILVNNAGVISAYSALDTPLTDTKWMFETNVFGMMAMVQEFMPLLMLSSDALIVNVGSIAAAVPLTFGSSYNATKAAVHEYTETLRLELEPLGIKVMLIQMGGVGSVMGLGKRTTDNVISDESFYKPIEKEYQASRKAPEYIMTPAVFASKVVSASMKKHPLRRTALGSGATVAMLISRWVPNFWLVGQDLLFMKMTSLSKLASFREAAAKAK